MITVFILANALAVLLAGFLLWRTLRTLVSLCVYPAIFREEKAFDRQPRFGTSSLLGKRDFHLIHLSGNCVTSPAAMQTPSEQDVLKCANLITKEARFSIEGYHPGYHDCANELVQRLVKHVQDIKNQHPNVRIILSGWSLGGGLSMVAAAELKKKGVHVDVINVRSFSSIGSVVVAWLGLDPNRVYNRPLRGLINGILWLFGGWDIDATRALDQLKSSPLVMNPSHSSTLLSGHTNAGKPCEEHNSPQVHIATWKESDDVIGNGFLREKTSSNVFFHTEVWDEKYRRPVCAPIHAIPVPISLDARQR